jgi:hypothetical protein
MVRLAGAGSRPSLGTLGRVLDLVSRQVELVVQEEWGDRYEGVLCCWDGQRRDDYHNLWHLKDYVLQAYHSDGLSIGPLHIQQRGLGVL